MPPPLKASPAVGPTPSGLRLPTVEVPPCLAVQSCTGSPSSSPCRRGSQLSPKALCPTFSTRPLHPWQRFVKTDAFQECQSSLGRCRPAIPGCPQEPDWRGRRASQPPILDHGPPCGPLEGLVGRGQRKNVQGVDLLSLAKGRSVLLLKLFHRHSLLICTLWVSTKTKTEPRVPGRGRSGRAGGGGPRPFASRERLWEAGSSGGLPLPLGFGRKGTRIRKPQEGEGAAQVRKRQDFLRVQGLLWPLGL